MAAQHLWKRLTPAVAVALVLLLWQATTVSGVIDSDQFPTAVETLAALARLTITAAYWESVGATLLAWLLGMVVAGGLAVVVGSVLGANDTAARSAASVIEIFKALPAIAIVPLVIMVFGSTLPMKVFVIAFGVFWPLVIQIIYGVRSIDPVALDTARTLGVRGVRRFLSLTVPSAAPFIATGLRIAAASALILAVVSELVGGATGIGRNILQAQNAGVLAHPVMYAYIITAGLVGLVLTGAFLLLERKAMHWHESQRNRRVREGVSR